MWGETFRRLFYKPLAYTNRRLDYQFAYQQGPGEDWQDISLIIYWGNKPIAIWPLSFSIKDGRRMLTSQGLPVWPPVFVENCPSTSRKRISKDCQNVANAISVDSQLNLWESGKSFDESLGMSDWHIESMARDASCQLRHEMYLDLRQTMMNIKGIFEKVLICSSYQAHECRLSMCLTQ